MDVYTASEQAYKNGYNAGVKELAEKLIAEYKGIDETYHQIYYSSLVAAVTIL